MAMNPSLVPEIGPDGLPREAPVIAYTEKVIEAEQLQLRKYIEENYSKIRDVERELSNLSLELKLTAGPKKAALEHMRKKIEMSTEKIRLAKLKEEHAQKISDDLLVCTIFHLCLLPAHENFLLRSDAFQLWEEASKAVKDEEAVKQKLCDDLSRLVQESSNAQYSRLEELKRRLEALNPSRASMSGPPDSKSAESAAAAPVTSVQPAQNADRQVAPVVNTQNQQPSVEGEGRGKRKIPISGRGGKGTGIVPKGRGSPGQGWTGTGFDVDGRN
ncbi:hypothetical protein Syun_012994 [Stephania yunnanensis]|uniref:RAB6-interacting golgin n=1 Tax=Stephania yunnanensis TaxID=152371 RepID=A0AAP0K1A1_9MAGN